MILYPYNIICASFISMNILHSKYICNNIKIYYVYLLKYTRRFYNVYTDRLVFVCRFNKFFGKIKINNTLKY